MPADLLTASALRQARGLWRLTIEGAATKAAALVSRSVVEGHSVLRPDGHLGSV